jgi:hypothetical protein
MKNKELFDKTVKVLVKAYQNETLEHCDCRACAIGNMVASTLPKLHTELVYPAHLAFYLCDIKNSFQIRKEYQDEYDRQLRAIGYTLDEALKIEAAFEDTVLCVSEDIDGFKGLMAVIDVLQEIHECTEEETKEAKLLFVK